MSGRQHHAAADVPLPSDQPVPLHAPIQSSGGGGGDRDRGFRGHDKGWQKTPHGTDSADDCGRKHHTIIRRCQDTSRNPTY